MNATTIDAIKLAHLVESIAPTYGAHVALTGGCLYKHGHRKDIDLLFYRIRQVREIDFEGLFAALEDLIGLEVTSRHGFVTKATWEGFSVDLLHPEHPGDSEYE